MSNATANELNAAADVLQREAKRYEALAAAAVGLRDAASLIGQVEEARTTLETLRGEADLARQARAAAEEAGLAAMAQSEADVNAAKAEAQALVDNAKVEAASIIDMAVAARESVEAESKTKCANAVADANSQVGQAQERLTETAEQLTKVVAEIGERTAELADIEGRIKQAREKIAAFAST